MKMNTRKIVGCLLLVVVITAVMSSTGPSLRASERVPLAVIVSKTSPLSELSSAQLTRMYMGDLVDNGGRRLIPLNRAISSEEREQFDRVVLGKSPDEMARYWIDRKIRGQSGAPKAVEPVDVYARVIAKLDGAIGYVHVNDVRDDVKVLRIDGKSPTEHGYPIRY
jgi:ABC-type phosphate transport system substrate-binding protein